jgi:hypothetical protein
MEDLTTGAWCYYEFNSKRCYGKIIQWSCSWWPTWFGSANYHVPVILSCMTYGPSILGNVIFFWRQEWKPLHYGLALHEAATNSSGFTGLQVVLRLRRRIFPRYWWNSYLNSTEELVASDPSLDLARYNFAYHFIWNGSFHCVASN